MDGARRLRTHTPLPPAGKEMVENDQVHRWKELKFHQK